MPLHLAHLQFYGYGTEGKRGFSSQGARLAALVNARKEITVAAVEFALARGIEQLIFVTHTSWVPTILSVGWDIELLGLPRRDGNETISAMRIHVTPATLDLLRGNWGVTGSMLEMDEDRIAAAA